VNVSTYHIKQEEEIPEHMTNSRLEITINRPRFTVIIIETE
jgi:hypothetical protein